MTTPSYSEESADRAMAPLRRLFALLTPVQESDADEDEYQGDIESVSRAQDALFSQTVELLALVQAAPVDAVDAQKLPRD